MVSIRTLEQKLKRIEDIVQDEPLVLLDGSIIPDGKGMANWYYSSIYGCYCFSKLNFGLVETILENLDSIISIFSMPNTHTVSPVADEIKRIKHIVYDKLRWLRKQEEIYVASMASRRRQIGSRKYSQMQRGRSLMENLCFGCCTLSRKAAKSVLKINDSRYDDIVDFMLDLSERSDVKRRYGWEDTSGEHEDLHGDEYLAAASLYLSLVEGKRNAIITRDSDIRRLLLKAEEYMLRTESYRLVVDAFSKAPVLLYYVVKKGTGELQVDTQNRENSFWVDLHDEPEEDWVYLQERANNVVNRLFDLEKKGL
jgi:hypothetical protein